MKRIGRFFAIVMLVCVALCNCAWIPQPVPKSLGGISPGKPFMLTKTTLIYGPSNKIKNFPDYTNSRNVYSFWDHGLTVAVNKNNRVSWVMAGSTSTLGTEHGIKIGSPLFELISTYGFPNNNDPSVFVYYTPDHKSYGCKFFISRTDHKVCAIFLGNMGVDQIEPIK